MVGFTGFFFKLSVLFLASGTQMTIKPLFLFLFSFCPLAPVTNHSDVKFIKNLLRWELSKWIIQKKILGFNKSFGLILILL